MLSQFAPVSILPGPAFIHIDASQAGIYCIFWEISQKCEKSLFLGYLIELYSEKNSPCSKAKGCHSERSEESLYSSVNEILRLRLRLRLRLKNNTLPFEL